MLASRLTRSLGQGVKLRQEIIDGCCRQKRPGEGRLLQQKRGIVLKRTYSPPLVKPEVIAGGAMTIPVTQERIDKSVPDDVLYQRYEMCEEETEADETVPPIQIILVKPIEEFGKKGQVLTMPSEKAHKELLYHGLAVYASPANLETYKDILIPEDAVQFSSKYIQKNYAELSRKVLCLTMHDLNPWKLEKWHVRLAMRQEGIYVQNDDAITINSKTLTGPDSRLQGKELLVKLKVNQLEDIRLRAVIYQNSEKLFTGDEDADIPMEDILAKDEIPPPGWQWMFNEPVFEDERQELLQIPRHDLTDEVAKQNPSLKKHLEKFKQWRVKRDEVYS